MARRKVTLAFINNEAERKASYKKRKKGLIKKMSELCILCDVKGCLIIYSQIDPEPVVWPSCTDAQAILARFRKHSETDQGRKMVSLESFIHQRIKKAEDKLRRLKKENKCREVECYMYQCITGTRNLDDTHLSDASDMNWGINHALYNIQAKQEALKAEFCRREAVLPPPTVDQLPPLPELPPLPPPLPTVPTLLPPPLAEKENLESFSWNRVPSPMGGSAADLEPGDFGWDPPMVQPPYMFNASTSDQPSSDQPENQGNNSNDFNYFNYFNN